MVKVNRKKKKQGLGFTLIEIMLVVVIIGFLMAFAIPNALRSRISAAEVTAMEGCRAIATGCNAFYSAAAPSTYPDTLEEMSGSSPSYLDPVLAAGTKEGYQFLYARVDPQRFEIRAEPVSPGVSGSRFFYLDQSGVLRVNSSSSAGPTDPPAE